MIKNKFNLRNVIAIVICLSVTTIFSGCNKENEEPEKFTLVGKTYAAQAYRSVVSGDWVYWVYRFTSSNSTERTARESNPQGSMIGTPEIYTYELDYPNLTIWNANGTQLLPFTFIDENTIRFTDSRGVVYEYIKQ